MNTELDDKLIIAISSRALFDLDESNRVFEEQGAKAYEHYQVEHENVVLKEGIAFSLVQKLLNLNQEQAFVEVILSSRNSADTGLRVFNSIQHYGLNITRAAFTSGESPYSYLKAFGAHLFLSANPLDVEDALSAGIAAATMLPSSSKPKVSDRLRIAFDGDSVLFSDESECIYQKEGFEAFSKNEQDQAHDPLADGPFKGFLSALHSLQTHFPVEQCPIRTALVTARSAPAHERVIRTLRAWKIRIDESLFLGGLDRGAFLQAFQADIYFDDQQGHCQSTSQHVATGHVPHGTLNPR